MYSRSGGISTTSGASPADVGGKGGAAIGARRPHMAGSERSVGRRRRSCFAHWRAAVVSGDVMSAHRTESPRPTDASASSRRSAGEADNTSIDLGSVISGRARAIARERACVYAGK